MHESDTLLGSQTFVSELRIVLVVALMLTLPGWAILVVAGGWRMWDRLQRWCVAIGLSIAFYPVLFYGVRAVVSALAGTL